MRNTFIPVLFLLFASSVCAGQLYKWVDENGNVHYSETPVEGAEAVNLPKPTTFDGPAVQPRRSTDDGKPLETFRYAEFQFVSPQQDQVFWATGGDIPVQLDSAPPLRPGHRMQLYFNGELTDGSPLGTLGTTLTGVERGTHTVRAVVIDEAGNEVASAGPVTFHVKQRSLANPQNPPPRRPGGKKP